MQQPLLFWPKTKKKCFYYWLLMLFLCYFHTKKPLCILLLLLVFLNALSLYLFLRGVGMLIVTTFWSRCYKVIMVIKKEVGVLMTCNKVEQTDSKPLSGLMALFMKLVKQVKSKKINHKKAGSLFFDQICCHNLR